jgi:CRISPR-associated protein Csb2
MRALMKVDHLLIPRVGRFDLDRLSPEQNALYNLRAATWMKPARRWSSVTPILLDRFPKKGRNSIGAIIARSCENVGLPRPLEVFAARCSSLHGVEPSFRFVTQRRSPSAPNARLYTHVEVTFEQEVAGPILLGAGRHFGLGLMRPLQEDPVQ